MLFQRKQNLKLKRSTSLADPDKITTGKDAYDILHPEIKSKFTKIKDNIDDWKYTDRRTSELYKLYILQN
jgi:hypothetical protein